MKEVCVLIGEDNEGTPREVQSDWTVKEFLEDIYSALEETGEFDDLLHGRKSFSMSDGRNEYHYLKHDQNQTLLKNIAAFDWERKYPDEVPRFWFNFVNFYLT